MTQAQTEKWQYVRLDIQLTTADSLAEVDFFVGTREPITATAYQIDEIGGVKVADLPRLVDQSSDWVAPQLPANKELHIVFEFTGRQAIKQYQLGAASATSAQWKLFASNDLATWTLLDSTYGQSATLASRGFTVATLDLGRTNICPYGYYEPASTAVVAQAVTYPAPPVGLSAFQADGCSPAHCTSPNGNAGFDCWAGSPTEPCSCSLGAARVTPE